MTPICVSKLTIIGPDKDLSPGRRQAIIWTNAEILLITPLGTKFIEILIQIYTSSLTKMHLKMSSGKWQPFCLGLDVLRDGEWCTFSVSLKWPLIIDTVSERFNKSSNNAYHVYRQNTVQSFYSRDSWHNKIQALLDLAQDKVDGWRWWQFSVETSWVWWPGGLRGVGTTLLSSFSQTSWDITIAMGKVTWFAWMTCLNINICINVYS